MMSVLSVGRCEQSVPAASLSRATCAGCSSGGLAYFPSLEEHHIFGRKRRLPTLPSSANAAIVRTCMVGLLILADLPDFQTTPKYMHVSAAEPKAQA